MKKCCKNKFFLALAFLIIQQLTFNILQAQNAYLDSLKTALMKAPDALDSVQILCQLTMGKLFGCT